MSQEKSDHYTLGQVACFVLEVFEDGEHKKIECFSHEEVATELKKYKGAIFYTRFLRESGETEEQIGYHELSNIGQQVFRYECSGEGGHSFWMYKKLAPGENTPGNCDICNPW